MDIVCLCRVSEGRYGAVPGVDYLVVLLPSDLLQAIQELTLIISDNSFKTCLFKRQPSDNVNCAAAE